MSGPPVICEVEDRILTVTLNDPDRRNPITGAGTIQGILAALERAQTDPAISVAILTGAGTAFCAGGDIKAMQDPAGEFRQAPLDVADSYRGGVQRIPLAIYNLDVPIIAAVNGPAVGAGCDLAMMCDIRIASETARFGEVFVNLGIISGDAGSWYLVRRLGYQRAAELTFTGRLVNAREALKLDLVIDVTSPEELMTRARELAAVIAAKPPRAVRASKRLLRHAERMDLPDFLSTASAYQALMHATKDHSEALNAFLEKREGRFTGQ